jgi:PAS domain S-box-containing protein
MDKLHPFLISKIGEDRSIETLSGSELRALIDEVNEELERRDQEKEDLVNSRHDRFRSVLRALSDGLCTLDSEGRCVTINAVAEQYLGGNLDNLIGQKILSYFKLSANSENSPDTFHMLWTSIKIRLALRFEQAVLVRPDGSSLAVSCVFNPLIENNEVVGCVFVFRDVTATRRAEAELRKLNDALMLARDEAIEASKSKSTFLANMSHELRTPLNAIIGYAELVAEDAAEIDSEEGTYIAQDINKIHSAAGHLLDIINDILDVSKIEAGKMEVFAETFDVFEMIYSVSTTVEGLVGQNRNKLEVQCDDAIGSMHTDKMKLRQSLLNLLSNAAKFTNDGTISLRVWREFGPSGDWIYFEVKDTGIGIPQNRISHLFESFTQADQSTTRKFGGTGLGLTITYQFCHMIGGDVNVASEEGVGSTFTIGVPANIGLEEISSAEPLAIGLEEDTSIPDQPFSAVGTSQHLVLSIDDDPQAADLVSRFLPEEEFYVIHASNGEEGLTLARRLRPDVITLDVMMPGIDGWSVLSRLKADPDLSSIPVIMLTITGERQRSFTLGATDYLTKPIQRSRLIDMLRRYSSSEGRVMIVEDDDETRNILQRVLEGRGWRTLLARNGREALELLETHVPDVMLLDLMMPELDGFGVLEKLREDDRYLELPVIVLTAMELSVEELQRLNAHVTEVLQKGATSTTNLVNLVRSVLGKG